MKHQRKRNTQRDRESPTYYPNIRNWVKHSPRNQRKRVEQFANLSRDLHNATEGHPITQVNIVYSYTFNAYAIACLSCGWTGYEDN